MATRFQTLPGFRDFYPEDCATRNYVFRIWREVARRYGFVEYDAPVLEPTDLYRKKSGDEIVNQLFCFTDKGEREVAMRPELTPSLARMAAARQRDFRKPLRWFSIGQFFRYEKHQKGRGREFYQFNCDILGEDSTFADAELMALSIDLMREFGFGPSDFRLRISDRDAWVRFALEKGLSAELIPSFLQIIDKMDRTPADKVAEQLRALGLERQQIDDFTQSGAETSPAIQQVMEGLRARGFGDFVEIDLGIVRGLAYYTGLVFEIFDIGKGMRAVAGGGRYDQLVDLIGGVSMAACGFAMGDMVISDLIRESTDPANRMNQACLKEISADVYVVLADPERALEAIGACQSLRDAGLRVISSLTPIKVAKQFQAAEQANARYALVIGAEFPTLTLRLLSERSEREVTMEQLIADLTRRN